MISYVLICFMLFFYFSTSHSQIKEHSENLIFDASKKFSISFYGTYISSFELQNDVRSPDPIKRAAVLELKGSYGYGAEFNYKPQIFNFDLIFFISTEYIKSTDKELIFRLQNNDTDGVNVRMEETVQMLPVEAGVKWQLPVGSNSFKIFMGGGAGIYFGDRTRKIGSFTTRTLDKTPGYSVNILAGIDFYVVRNISLTGMLKFREGYWDVQNKFEVDAFTVNGITYPIENPFYSRLIADGVRLSLGLKYNF